MMQVLAYRPILSDCIPLTAFEKWMDQYTPSYRIGAVFRLCVTEGNDDVLAQWSLEELQSVFVKCVYLSARENLDGFHFRFEEEWNIIDFFLKSLDRFGKPAIQHQSDEFFNEMVEFFRIQSEMYPYLTFGVLYKKIHTLLDVFESRHKQQTPTEIQPTPVVNPTDPIIRMNLLTHAPPVPLISSLLETLDEDDEEFFRSIMNISSLLRPRPMSPR